MERPKGLEDKDKGKPPILREELILADQKRPDGRRSQARINHGRVDWIDRMDDRM
jgi:hypothetical protein